MTTFNVSAKDYAKTFRANERARARRVAGAAYEAAKAGAEVVAERVPVDEGELKASIRARKVGGVEIVCDAPHAGIIENGARPHMPPWEPILEWVRRHEEDFAGQGGSLTGSKARRSRLVGPLTEAATATLSRRQLGNVFADLRLMQIVQAIRWKISKFGSPPHWFMRSSLEDLRRILKEVVERRIRD